MKRDGMHNPRSQMTMSDETQVTVETVADTTTAAANPDATAAIVPAVVEGQGQVEADAVEADKADPVGAPETYATFTLPEGFTLDGDRLDMAQGLFKELGLTQVAAQKAVEAFCKADGENLATQTAFLESERQQRIETWGQQAKETFGPKYDETITLARAGVTAVNSPALLEAFNSEGWGNHPELIKAFAKLGELTRGSGPQGLEGETTVVDRSSIPIERRLYPNMA